MKFQYLLLMCAIAKAAHAWSFWSLITQIVDIFESISASVCGAEIIAGQAELAFFTCTVAAVVTGIDYGLKNAVNGTKIHARDDGSCDFPLIVNDVPVCLHQLPENVWHHGVSADKTGLSVMKHPSALVVGFDLPTYHYSNKDKRAPNSKDMYIEFHNATLLAEDMPGKLELEDLAHRLLQKNVLVPGKYRSHMEGPSGSKLDLMIHTGATDYTPSFL